jgi:hypothetical protein
MRETGVVFLHFLLQQTRETVHDRIRRLPDQPGRLDSFQCRAIDASRLVLFVAAEAIVGESGEEDLVAVCVQAVVLLDGVWEVLVGVHQIACVEAGVLFVVDRVGDLVSAYHV